MLCKVERFSPRADLKLDKPISKVEGSGTIRKNLLSIEEGRKNFPESVYIPWTSDKGVRVIMDEKTFGPIKNITALNSRGEKKNLNCVTEWKKIHFNLPKGLRLKLILPSEEIMIIRAVKKQAKITVKNPHRRVSK